MNIKYHLIQGLILEYCFDLKGMGLIGSIFPDLTLVRNEIKLRINKEKFNAERVSKIDLILYRSFHSIWILLIGFIDIGLMIGIFFHLLSDFFTHIGLFSPRPFYPFKYIYKNGNDYFFEALESKYVYIKKRDIFLVAGDNIGKEYFGGMIGLRVSR